MLYAISFKGVALIEAKDNDEAIVKFAQQKKGDLVKEIRIKHIEETEEKK